MLNSSKSCKLSSNPNRSEKKAGQFTVRSLLAFVLVASIGLAISRYVSSLGISLIVISFGVFLGKLGVRHGKAKFIIHTIVTTLFIIGAVTLGMAFGDIVLVDSQYSYPPGAQLVSAMVLCASAFFLKVANQYSAAELLTALGMILFAVPVVVFLFVGSLENFGWVFLLVGGGIIAMVAVPFAVGIAFGIVYSSFLRK